MTPNFALFLSFDGIVLLQRVPEGWQRVGATRLEAQDLNAEMAALHARASELSDGELRTKLILPNDQVRFLAIDTARTTQDDIQAAVLDATPLALDEVQIDYDQSGGRTYIAAVAKQTLLEAETFAQEHQFHPVDFAALAEPYTFRNAVSFGLTAYAQETFDGAVEIEPVDADVLRAALQNNSVTRLAPEPLAAAPVEPIDDLPVFVSRNRIAAKSEATAPVAQFSRSATSRSETAEFETPPPVATAEEAPEKSVETEAVFTARRESPRPYNSPDVALERGLGVVETERRSILAPVALTVGLLAVVGGAGYWATRGLDTNLAGLFTLDPGLQEDALAQAPVIATAPDPEPVPTPEATAVVTAPAPEADALLTPEEEVIPPTPIVTAIPGRVLSPADAARIYAATGVWQRAPRLPDRNGDKQGNLDGIHEFDVLPAIAKAPMPGSPAGAINMHELRMISPLNPTPPNRSLLRDEDGFILAPALGTVLPTGVPIFGRAPSKRPPLRPTDERIYLRDDSIPLVQLDVVTGVELVSYTAESTAPTARAFAAPVLSQPQPVLSPLNTQPQAFADDIALVTTPADPLPPEPAPEIMRTMTALAAAPAEPTAEQLIGTSFANPSQTDGPFSQQVPTRAKATTLDRALAPPPLDNEGAPTGVVVVIQGTPDVVPPLRPDPDQIAAAQAINDDLPVYLDVISQPSDDGNLIATAEADAFAAFSFSAPVLSQPQPVINPQNTQPQAFADDVVAVTTPAAPLPADSEPTIMTQMTAVAVAPTTAELIGTPLATSSQIDGPFDQQAPVRAKAVTQDAPLASPPLDDTVAPAGVVVVIEGRPDVVPPLRPGSEQEVVAQTEPTETTTTADPDLSVVAGAIQDALTDDAAPTPEDDLPDLSAAIEEALETPVPLQQDPTLAGFRPTLRPASLLPASTRTFEAIPELAAFRPTTRPTGLVPTPVPEAEIAEVIQEVTAAPADIASIVASIAEAAPPSLIVSPTQRAIGLSPRPDPRPQNFARVVSAAQAITARQQPAATQTTRTAAVVQTPAPATAPAVGGRTGATVARAATVDNAIRLGDLNLIGVYGKPGARRALVRMPNGRFVKVEVGSSLDGGRVTAIDDSALNFVKRGRTYALQLPTG